MPYNLRLNLCTVTLNWKGCLVDILFYDFGLGLRMAVATHMAWILVLLCFHSSGISASSSSTGYMPPICEEQNGFYCPAPDSSMSTFSCPPRSQRCAGDGNSTQCTQKTYQHCDYVSADGKFIVYRYSSPLALRQLLGGHSRSTRSGILACLRIKPEHQFITYRGLTYEFGLYGTRVQDPNDPNYEYNTRSSYDRTYLGLSSCTYEEVMTFVNTWSNSQYRLCSHNCQDFARGLGKYLTTDCARARTKRGRRQSDDDLAGYIFSISGANCTSGFTSSGSQLVASLPLLFSTALAAGVFTLVH